MIQYISPEEVSNNPQYIQIVIRTDSLGKSNFNGITHFTRIDKGDGWDDVLYYRRIGVHTGEESVKNRLGGYVYILVNSAYPGKCKIGMTTGTPESRLQQINNAGVVDDWELGYSFKCSRPYDFEQAMHHKLADIRSRSDREFFNLELDEAIDILLDMANLFGPL